MRRFFIFLLLISLTLPVFAAVADSASSGTMYVYTPNGRALYFRATRSISDDNIIRQIPYGAQVFVASMDVTWARIEYDGDTGYVVRKYLQRSAPAPYKTIKAQQEAEEARKQEEAAAQQAEKDEIAAQQAAQKAARKELQEAQKKLDRKAIKSVLEYDVTVLSEVEGVLMNMYKNSSLLSSIIRVYEGGERLTVIAQNDDWAKVYDAEEDLVGYMLRMDLIEDLVEEEILDD